MRDYRLKTSKLPEHIYLQVRGIVKGYENMLAEYEAIPTESPSPPDGQPRGTGISNATMRQALKRADLARKIEAVEAAYSLIPEEYRVGVWENVTKGKPYPSYADRGTYWRYKANFYRNVAKKLFLI